MEHTLPFFDLGPSWNRVLNSELQEAYLLDLAAFIQKERACETIYPEENLQFQAFLSTPFEKVKVLIMGQDPYHGPGQAEGLSFSVPRGMPLPPSLKNIFKELASDLEIKAPHEGHLKPWADQGVLLLNSALTVRQGAPQSHQGIGWELFTDAVMKLLVERKTPLVFILWGNAAQKKVAPLAKAFKASPHLLLKGAHPSPLSAYRGFFGCRHFSATNQFLVQNKITPIQWEKLSPA